MRSSVAPNWSRTTRTNTYYAPSSLNGKARDLQHFAALHVLVLDDIKADVLAKLPPPTYALETSAGNYQVGYKLEAPLTDLEFARAIHQALQSAGYCDKNGNNPVRWVRLPVGMNTKPGKMFAHKLRVWAPDRCFEVMALIEALGLNLDAAPTAGAKKHQTLLLTWLSENSSNPVCWLSCWNDLTLTPRATTGALCCRSSARTWVTKAVR